MPNKIAIYTPDKEVTYRQFYDAVQMIQSHLLAFGKNKQPLKIGVLLNNDPEFLEVFFAIITAGYVAIPLDPGWTVREAEHVIDRAEPDLIITQKAMKFRWDNSLKNTYYVEDLKASHPTPIKTIARRNFQQKPFYLGFTSGSTGAPKGFIRNHHSWLTSFSAGEEAFQYGSEDVIMAPGPLCHSLSLFGATHALHIGASFIMTKNFSAQLTFDEINSGQATVLYAVPTMLHTLAKLKESTNRKVTILSSGAKLSPLIKKGLYETFPNASLYEYYGASELSFATYSDEQLATKYPDSVGKPFPGVKISIRDTVGNVLPAGEIGHIFIESPFIFSGYVNNEAATQEVLTKNGVNIGDVGFLNKDGALTIVGRAKHMIIRGGQNVYPEEVEKTIKELNDVDEVVVVGIEDDKWGQTIVALIAWKQGVLENETLAKVKQHVKKHLSPYKRPRHYYSVTEFPYTKTGKVARSEIEANITRWVR